MRQLKQQSDGTESRFESTNTRRLVLIRELLGQESALNELYAANERWYPGTVEDLVQDVCVRVCESSVPEGYALGPTLRRNWLRTVATNLVTDKVRKRRKYALEFKCYDDEERPDGVFPSWDTSLEWLMDASPEQRIVLYRVRMRNSLRAQSLCEPDHDPTSKERGAHVGLKRRKVIEVLKEFFPKGLPSKGAGDAAASSY